MDSNHAVCEKHPLPRETAVDTQDTCWPGFGQLFVPWPWRINWVTSYDERGRGMEHVAATPLSSPTFFLPAAPAAHTCLPHVFSGKNPSQPLRCLVCSPPADGARGSFPSAP